MYAQRDMCMALDGRLFLRRYEPVQVRGFGRFLPSQPVDTDTPEHGRDCSQGIGAMQAFWKACPIFQSRGGMVFSRKHIEDAKESRDVVKMLVFYKSKNR